MIWLLEVTLGGREIRVSTQPVVVGEKAYQGTLDGVELREKLQGVGRLPSEREASLTLSPEFSLAPFSQLQGRAILRLWTGVGQGRIELQGLMRAAEVQGATEPLSFLLSGDPWSDTASTHDPAARVMQTPRGTWFAPRDDAIGVYYPRIFGVPGNLIGSRGEKEVNVFFTPVVERSTTPGRERRANKLLICDAENHQRPLRVNIIAEESAEEDGLIGITFGASDLGPAPELATDALGRDVWVVDVSGVGLLFRRGVAHYGVILDQQAVAYARSSVRPVLTVGQMIQLLVREANIAIDESEWARTAEELAYRVGLVVREPMSPLDIVAEVVQDLPVAYYATPSGLGIVRWPYDATRDDAVARLVEGRNCSRESGLRQMREPSAAVAAVIVEYAYSERFDRMLAAAAASSAVEDALDPDYNASVDVWSRTADRDGSVELVEAGWCVDEQGALEVAKWGIRRNAIGAREIGLRVDAALARSLLLASVVLLDVPSLGLINTVGVVASRTMTDEDAWSMSFVLFSPIGLDQQSRPTGGRTTPPPTIVDPPTPQQ